MMGRRGQGSQAGDCNKDTEDGEWEQQIEKPGCQPRPLRPCIGQFKDKAGLRPMQGNLITHDPLVSAIFEAVNAVPAEPFERIMAVQRAGQIAEAYIGQNSSPESRRVWTISLKDSARAQPSPSESQ